MQKNGWIVERKKGVNYFIKKFPLIGSFVKIQRPEIIDEKQIEEITKRHKAFKIVVEPKNFQQVKKIKAMGFSLSKTIFLPSKTILINLKESENKLLSQMHHKTRYNIKVAEKKGVIIKEIKKIELFAGFWQSCALKQRLMFIPQKKEILKLHQSFGRNSHILVAIDPENKNYKKIKPDCILSGILMLLSEKTAYYMYAASSQKGKKLFAPTLNLWACLKLAKNLGCDFFDLEGIYDERFPIRSWEGFSRFKKSFGGKIKVFPGCFFKTNLDLKKLLPRLKRVRISYKKC